MKPEMLGERCVVITHESGLEVFLLGVGGFVTAKTGAFVLSRLLEAIERRITGWFSHRRSRQIDHHRPPHSVKSGVSFVEKILVRTPNWEIAVDGRFTASERKELLDHLGRILVPPSRI